MWCYREDTPFIEMIHVSSLDEEVFYLGMLLRSPWVLVLSPRGGYPRDIEGPCILSPRGGYPRDIEGPCMKPKRRLRYGWLEFESGFTGKPYSLF